LDDRVGLAAASVCAARPAQPCLYRRVSFQPTAVAGPPPMIGTFHGVALRGACGSPARFAPRLPAGKVARVWHEAGVAGAENELNPRPLRTKRARPPHGHTCAGQVSRPNRADGQPLPRPAPNAVPADKVWWMSKRIGRPLSAVLRAPTSWRARFAPLSLWSGSCPTTLPSQKKKKKTDRTPRRPWRSPDVLGSRGSSPMSRPVWKLAGRP